MGQTNIVGAMQKAVDLDSGDAEHKRVILITDGYHNRGGNKNDIIA